MRFAGYVRVSAVGGRDQQNGHQFIISPSEQRQDIEQYCDASGYELVEVVEDMNASGRNERAKLERLIRQVEAGELDGIIVNRLNRFGRNVEQGKKNLRRIRKAGGNFIALDLKMDTTVPSGKMLETIILAVSEWESDDKQERTHAALRARIESGRHWGRRPLGYDLDEHGFLTPNDDAELVRQAFQRYAEGEPVRSIARTLREQGGRTADGPVTSRYVRDLFSNEVYVGVLRAGDLVGEHKQPLIERELWTEVQARLGSRSAPKPGVKSALGGLVRCWACRHTMTASWSHTKKGKQRCYRCPNENCQRGAFALEAELLPLALAAFFDRVENIEKQRMVDSGDELRKLETQRQKAEAAIARLVELADTSAQPIAGIAERINTHQTRLALLDRRERELQSEPQRNGVPEYRYLTQEWPQMPHEEKRRMFQLVFAAIVVQAPQKRRDHSIPVEQRTRFLPVSEADDLPRPGRKSDSQPFPDFDDYEFWPDAPAYDREQLVSRFKHLLSQAHGDMWGPRQQPPAAS